MEDQQLSRVKQIVDEALKRPPAERERYVREVCTDDPETCQRTLTVLSSQELPSPKLQWPGGPEIADDFADLVPGTHIDRYTIVDRIGRGGMGQVFLARDAELRRKVALKCLLSSNSPPGVDRARILNEAIAAAAISHTHVATVYHVVEDHQRVFIVMEYVEGESLSTKLRRDRQLPIPEIVSIGRQLAAALRAAHAKDVVHRDIKPANIQIAVDGSVKVLDFGVAIAARALSTVATDVSTDPRTRQRWDATVPRLAGTPPYMSPEQLKGEELDERSDLYSLGVVLYEMTAGQRLFSSDRDEIVEAQKHPAPRVDAVRSGVPRALANLIARALEPERRARWQSATEMEAALERIARDLDKTRTAYGELILKWSARLGLGAAFAMVALGLDGSIVITGYNLTFGRTGPFARFGVEPWSEYFHWGRLAAIPEIVAMTAMAIVALTVAFAFRTLELIGPIGRLTKPVRAVGRRVARACGLDTAVGLAQGLIGLGILLIVALCWSDRALIGAWTSFFNSAPIEALLPMGESQQARLYYHIKIDAALLAVGFGLFNVLKLRERENTREGRGAIALLVGVLMLLILMNEASFRTLHYRDLERVDLAGARCYISAETADEVLVLCPGGAPPRNHAVSRNDPALHRSGELENVFRGVTQSSKP